jgi:4-hydroxybenzoate polyprenyltransferase
MKYFISLLRLDKPSGIFLLLWPTLWALWLAGKGKPDLVIVSIFILGVILMRSAGCVINDIADRHIDCLVARTQDRPLAAGKVTLQAALLLFFVLMFCAFLLVLLFNRLTILLAFVGALLAIGYPFLKRFTHLPQVGLGLAFSWGVPMAFAALTDTLPVKGWLFFFVAVLWPIIYDTQYAMVDRADDVRIGVKSTAILFGKMDKWLLGLLQILFLVLLLMVGYFFQLTRVYYLSVIGAGILFIYQQILIKDRLPQQCFKAFKSHCWVGGIIFLGIFLNYAE